jgi:hypothetical protein
MNNCFIIMPISTSDELIEEYGEAEHFKHVLEHLFIPSVEACGLQPIPPIVAGSDVIHGEIVRNLSSANLVLCDMSQLNPNVFFEFGIRTALNKPVALVIDNKTKKIPFDTGIINYHLYDSDLRPWKIEDERLRLSKHIAKTLESDPDKNALWKYFGITQTAIFDPTQITPSDKLDLILNKLDFFAKETQSPMSNINFDFDVTLQYDDLIEAFDAAIRDYFNQLMERSAGDRSLALKLSGMRRTKFYEMYKRWQEDKDT